MYIFGPKRRFTDGPFRGRNGTGEVFDDRMAIWASPVVSINYAGVNTKSQPMPVAPARLLLPQSNGPSVIFLHILIPGKGPDMTQVRNCDRGGRKNWLHLQKRNRVSGRDDGIFLFFFFFLGERSISYGAVDRFVQGWPLTYSNPAASLREFPQSNRRFTLWRRDLRGNKQYHPTTGKFAYRDDRIALQSWSTYPSEKTRPRLKILGPPNHVEEIFLKGEEESRKSWLDRFACQGEDGGIEKRVFVSTSKSCKGLECPQAINPRAL